MSCSCKYFTYLGTCGCTSNYEGMKNHFTNTQIRDIKNKFEDNLFDAAFYADEDAYSELFSKNKKPRDATVKKKKFNLGNLMEKAKSIADTTNELLSGGKSIAGEISGIKYKATVDSSSTDSDYKLPLREKDEDDKDQDKDSKDKDKDKTLLGMPLPVAIGLAVAVVILLLFVVLHLTSKTKA